MAKKFSPFFRNLLILLGTGLVKLIGRTWFYKRITPVPEGRVIYAFWHRNILPLLYLHQNEGIVVLISRSEDGTIVAGACQKLGYLTVRGSSRRGGGRATRQLINLSKTNSLVLTPDGPKGPVKKIKDGLVFLAKVTGLPVVPVALAIDKEKVFNSWDRFRLPLLFCRIRVIYGEKIYISRDADSQLSKEMLEVTMKELEKKLSMGQ